ncbi:MAG TPA: MMPL family transporter [Thermoleophilaceae bacterium]|nr:MMPL family transporter [Thermoleophilaceae bacterium]
MATYLYRLGRWAFDNRRKVLLGWVAVLVAIAFSAASFSGTYSEKFEVPGTESQRAQDLLAEKYPGAGGGSARVVYVAPDGEKLTDAENKAAVMESAAKAEQAKDVSMVVDPYSAKAISEDGRIGYTDVIYPMPADEVDDTAREELEATAEPADAAGLQVEFGGGLVTDETEAKSESIGILVGFLVLAITLGSLVAAGLPLLTALMGVGISVGAITALTGAFDLTETAPTLATMLGLAVGIDYALFILSRHRQNMGDGMEPREAAAQAAGTAGSAVVFAGLTVVIALVGLVVVNIPFLTVMGLAAAGAVIVAVLIATTLLPALLGFTGKRAGRLNRVLAFRPRGRKPGRETASVRYARFVTRRRWPVLVAGLVALLVVALPATHMKLGLPDGGYKAEDNTERKAYDLLTEGFGPGFNGVLTVVVDAPGSTEEQQKEIAGTVTSTLEEFPNVAAVSPPSQNEAGDVTIALVTPKTGPASDETKELVDYMREQADTIPEESGIEAYVTGTTALNIDTADTLAASLPRYIAVVVGLALLLLMVVFRSVWVPIKAAAGFLLSIAAAMGAVVWVFQDGNLAEALGVAQSGPIVSFLPVLLIGILFGLAMDYEVFLVSRMREAFVHSGDAREAVVTGYGQSGRVVTAAAVIMTAVFAAFLLDPDPVIKSIGFSLAVGVLVDAFIVRMTLVPAVMAVLGRRAWALPRRLERIVPEVDIEGEGLGRTLQPTPSP